MEATDIQPGVRVAIPTSKAGNEAPVFYLAALLANHAYPHDYLVVGEPYTSSDNVRLYMAEPFPQFCVESFNLADLSAAPTLPIKETAPEVL